MARRNARNRDFERGFGNRTDGVFKKSNTLHRTYGVRVASFVVGPNGHVKAYQSEAGLLAELASPSAQWDFSCGPETFATLASGRLGGPRPSSPRQVTASTSSSILSPPRSSLPCTPPMAAPLAWSDPAMGGDNDDLMDSVETCGQLHDLNLGLPSMLLPYATSTKAARHNDSHIISPAPKPTHRRTLDLLSRLTEQYL